VRIDVLIYNSIVHLWLLATGTTVHFMSHKSVISISFMGRGAIKNKDTNPVRVHGLKIFDGLFGLENQLYVSYGITK